MCKLHSLQFGFQNYLMDSLFIAYEDDKWCHFVVHIGSTTLISFYCGCFASFYLLQPYLVINVNGLVQFGKKLSYVLPPFYLSSNYLLIFISHLWLWFFRCLEKVFEEERNKNKEGNSRDVITS